MVPFTIEFVLLLIGTTLISLITTPLMRLIAFKIGAVDNPNARRINKVPMASAGGLAIVIAFLIASLIFMPLISKHSALSESFFDYILPISVAGFVIAVTGFVDDIKELSAKNKMLGLLLGAVIIALFTDFKFDSFKIPFGGPLIMFGPWLTFFLTVLWIVGVTNAVNFLDGLDGLVAGVSIICLTTMGLISNFFLFDTNLYVTLTIFILIAAIAGFFPYNYHPAIIYLGDTGALFYRLYDCGLVLAGFEKCHSRGCCISHVDFGRSLGGYCFCSLASSTGWSEIL